MSRNLLRLIPIVVVALSAAQPVQTARRRPEFVPHSIGSQLRQRPSQGRGSAWTGLDGVPFPIDTSLAYGPSVGSQDMPAVAFDGTNYLAVWVDYRSNSDGEIYATRISPDGTILDSGNIAVSTAAFIPWAPAVTFDGTGFLIVWDDQRSGNNNDIYGTRVSSLGVVLDSGDFAVVPNASSQDLPAIASDGTNSLVIWSGYLSGSAELYGTRVSASGAVLDTAGIAIGAGARYGFKPGVGSDGTNYLVVWSRDSAGQGSSIYGARVNPDGVVLDTSAITISAGPGNPSDPRVSFSGTNFLVVWDIGDSVGSSDIHGTRVSPTGAVLDSNGIVISSAPQNQFDPCVSAHGADYMVTWFDDRLGPSEAVYGARVSQDGNVLDTGGILISRQIEDDQTRAVATSSVNFLMVWQDTSYRVACARINTNGELIDTDAITTASAALDQSYPAASFDGVNYLVVWRNQRRAPDYEILAARVSPTGSVLDPVGILLGRANARSAPAAAFDGTNSLAVWEDSAGGKRRIVGARLSPAGSIIDTPDIVITTSADLNPAPAVSFDGTNYFVVWVDTRRGGHDIYGARVTPTGTVLDSGVGISVTPGYKLGSAICFGGSSYLVLWADLSSHVYGARVSTSGVVLDSAGIIVCPAGSDQHWPDVTFDGTDFLAVWSDIRSGVLQIYGTRINPDGAVLDSGGIFVSRGGFYPSVAFDGTNSLVVWSNLDGTSGGNLFGAYISPNGIRVGDSFPITTQEGPEQYSALARGTGSQLFLAYEGWANTVGGKKYNAYRVWGKLGPFGAITEHEPATVIHASREPTIIRGILFVPRPLTPDTRSPIALLDISGRKVLDLHPGPNDVSRLAPGVYFVRSADGGQRSAEKIVIEH